MRFTPRLSHDTGERAEMDIEEGIPRGRKWRQRVTDNITGKRWLVEGAECGSDSCFCDAVIVREIMADSMNHCLGS